MVILKHLHVGVVGQAVLADRGEIGGLPARAVEILLDLRRHGVGVQQLWHFGLSFYWYSNVESEKVVGRSICIMEPPKFL
jgi:hypothetical protein